MCFQDWRADLEAPIPVRLLRSHPGEETRSELPSPVLETAGGLSMLGCSPGPLSGAFPHQGRFSRWMADSLIDLTWAGSHRVVDLLGCSVLDEKELRSSPLEVHWIRWEDD